MASGGGEGPTTLAEYRKEDLACDSEGAQPTVFRQARSPPAGRVSGFVVNACVRAASLTIHIYTPGQDFCLKSEFIFSLPDRFEMRDGGFEARPRVQAA